jgi:hypothetical protein
MNKKITKAEFHHKCWKNIFFVRMEQINITIRVRCRLKDEEQQIQMGIFIFFHRKAKLMENNSLQQQKKNTSEIWLKMGKVENQHF